MIDVIAPDYLFNQSLSHMFPLAGTAQLLLLSFKSNQKTRTSQLRDTAVAKPNNDFDDSLANAPSNMSKPDVVGLAHLFQATVPCPCKVKRPKASIVNAFAVANDNFSSAIAAAPPSDVGQNNNREPKLV